MVQGTPSASSVRQNDVVNSARMFLVIILSATASSPRQLSIGPTGAPTQLEGHNTATTTDNIIHTHTRTESHHVDIADSHLLLKIPPPPLPLAVRATMRVACHAVRQKRSTTFPLYLRCLASWEVLEPEHYVPRRCGAQHVRVTQASQLARSSLVQWPVPAGRNLVRNHVIAG